MNYEPFHLDALVELQDQYSNVYPLSPAGARGWVRARRELPKADPEVYIEWDKGHWRYQGENDGWTFEHHFRLVEDVTPEAPVTDYTTLEDMLAEAQRQVDSERCVHCGETHDTASEFLDTLMDAQDQALGSDGYLIISVTPRQQDGTVVYEPTISSHALTDTAKRMLEMQIVYLASQILNSHTLEQIDAIEGPK